MRREWRLAFHCNHIFLTPIFFDCGMALPHPLGTTIEKGSVMEAHRRSLWKLALAILLSWPRAALAQESAAPVDPAVLVMPAAAPAFREVLKGAEWDKAFAEALRKLGDLEALAKSGLPEAGARIDTVDYFIGQGGQLGLKPGEVISEIDGVAVDDDHFAGRREERDQTITVVGVDGKARQVTISAGKIGVNLSPFVRPELVYLRRGTRDVRWDALVAVGGANCVSNPDLAETAWGRAMQAGYKADYLSDYCGMQIAWRQGRNEEAVAYCAMLHGRAGIPGMLSFEHITQQLAIGNFKIAQAMAMRMTAEPGESKAEGDLGDFLQGLLEGHRQLTEKQRFGPSPSEIASYVKTNLLKEMEPWSTHNEEYDKYNREAMVKLAKQEQPLEMSAPTAHYRAFQLIPKRDAEHVELIIRTKMFATDEQTSRYNKHLVVSLADCDEAAGVVDPLARRRNPLFLTVSINPQGLCRIEMNRSGLVRVTSIPVAEEIGDRRQFTLKLLHAGGREEVWIDRRRLLYLPAARQPKKVGFQLNVVGTTASVRADFSKLDPQQVPEK
jgi:hypothetical protein